MNILVNIRSNSDYFVPWIAPNFFYDTITLQVLEIKIIALKSYDYYTFMFNDMPVSISFYNRTIFWNTCKCILNAFSESDWLRLYDEAKTRAFCETTRTRYWIRSCYLWIGHDNCTWLYYEKQSNLVLHCTKNQRITPNIYTSYVCMAV